MFHEHGELRDGGNATPRRECSSGHRGDSGSSIEHKDRQSGYILIIVGVSKNSKKIDMLIKNIICEDLQKTCRYAFEVHEEKLARGRHRNEPASFVSPALKNSNMLVASSFRWRDLRQREF
jgi:hypothetical protein